MSKPDIHTVPHGDGWANRREGASRVSATYNTQAEANAAGRQTAIRDGVEHFTHGRDGQIRERNTYPRSSDPRASKG
ncbi:DUF2188 domain-containing protein [Dermacoccus barathri]